MPGLQRSHGTAAYGGGPCFDRVLGIFKLFRFQPDLISGRLFLPLLLELNFFGASLGPRLLFPVLQVCTVVRKFLNSQEPTFVLDLH